MLLPATTLSAIILGILLVVLSIRVILVRRATSASLGDGGDVTLGRRIRGQANLAEYAPIGLILILVAELQGIHPYLLEPVATIFVIGRLMHAIAFGFTDSWVIGRVGGTVLTFVGLVLLIILLLISGVSII